MKEWSVALTIDATAYVLDDLDRSLDEIREIARDVVTSNLSTNADVLVELEHVAAGFPFNTEWEKGKNHGKAQRARFP